MVTELEDLPVVVDPYPMGAVDLDEKFGNPT